MPLGCVHAPARCRRLFPTIFAHTMRLETMNKDGKIRRGLCVKIRVEERETIVLFCEVIEPEFLKNETHILLSRDTDEHMEVRVLFIDPIKNSAERIHMRLAELDQVILAVKANKNGVSVADAIRVNLCVFELSCE